MTMLGYLLVVTFAIVVPAALWGRRALWCATGAVILLSLSRISVPWMLALQGVTIWVAFALGSKLAPARKAPR